MHFGEEERRQEERKQGDKERMNSPAQCRYEDSDKLERNPPAPELLGPAGDRSRGFIISHCETTVHNTDYKVRTNGRRPPPMKRSGGGQRHDDTCVGQERPGGGRGKHEDREDEGGRREAEDGVRSGWHRRQHGRNPGDGGGQAFVGAKVFP